MNEEQAIELEARIQKLLAGTLGQADTAELLAEIARDAAARRVLDEMIDLQSTCRRLLACDVSDDDVRRGSRDTVASVDARPGRTVVSTKRRSPGHALLGFSWAIRFAAAVVVVASVYVALTVRLDSRLLRDELAKTRSRATVRMMAKQDLVYLQEVWAQVATSSEDVVPWVCLSDGGGAFGYLPATATGPGTDGLVLLHCVIVGADGREARRIRFLVPAYSESIAIPAAGRLAGQPVHLVVSSAGRWAGMNLAVGTDGRTGLRGRASVGGGAVEVGQFRVGAQKMTVFLQATAVARGEAL